MHYFPINKENKRNTQKLKTMRKHDSRKVSGHWSQHLPWGHLLTPDGQSRGQRTIPQRLNPAAFVLLAFELSKNGGYIFKGPS